MQLQRDWGTFIPGRVAIEGSFRINGTSDPDDIRDGNTGFIASVVRTSAGLFTVTLDCKSGDIPEKPVTEEAWVNPVDATQVLVTNCAVVADTWSQATKSFQILCTLIADTGASAYFDPLPGDPDDNSRVCFRIVGSLLGIGKD